MKTKSIAIIAAAALSACLSLSARAQLRTNGGVQYLLSQSKDMSQDFSDLSNHYFFADSLASFDTATGVGKVKWVLQPLSY
ncbi:MAG: alpha-xylosidase, partial [Duncaniella sp.]|nr:alpha-xylosidase [Duncaniella sp.]